MKIIKTSSELIEFRKGLSQKSVGFVPTMGALHAGHASLIKQSISQNEATIVSVFVNPTQFLAGEDLDKYPRLPEEDAKLCQSLGVNALFMPSADELYSEVEPLITAPSELASMLEGKTRPGHFDGVLRVLIKLFSLVRPNNAYFGKKDAQQLAIVQNMVKTLFLNLNIVPCEIVRESDGLALSSRNAYLDESNKCDALRLYRSLNNAATMVKNGELESGAIKESMLKTLEPLKVDYVAVVNRDFNEISKIEPQNSIILVAAYVGNVRLIDNIWI